MDEVVLTKPILRSPALSAIKLKVDESVQSFAKFIDDNYPFFNMRVPMDDLEGYCPKILHEFLPLWTQVSYQQCKDGITNKNTDESVLIRIYGQKSEILIDRYQEIVAKRLALTVIVDNSDMKDIVKAKLVASHVAKWHKLEITGNKEPALFVTLKRWIDGIPERYPKDSVHEKFKGYYKIQALRTEIDLLEEYCIKLNSPVVFCHNDLLSANIIYDEKKDSVLFIDYEYGSYNYRAFDIANHFCEFAGFECDYSKYPSKEFQLLWLKEYAPQEDHEALFEEVNKFSMMPHFFWCIWALVQARFSDIEFDYMSYSIMRYEEYNRRKNLLL